MTIFFRKVQKFMIPYGIEAIAEQNKLRLSDDEKAFVSEFLSQREAESTVLDTVILRDLPTDTRFSADKSSLRDDTVSAYPDPPTILNQAPATESEYFKVPKVKA